MFGNPCFQTFSELFDPKTGNYFQTFFQTFFVKFSQVQKNQLFPKNYQISKNELFRNLRKRKVRKFPSNAGPYFSSLHNAFSDTSDRKVKHYKHKFG